MRLTKDEVMILMNLLINDLAHDEWILSETYERQGKLGLAENFVHEIAGATLAMSVRKATYLKIMIARKSCPSPNEEGWRLIDFWLEVEKTVTEGEANDKQSYN